MAETDMSPEFEVGFSIKILQQKNKIKNQMLQCQKYISHILYFYCRRIKKLGCDGYMTVTQSEFFFF